MRHLIWRLRLAVFRFRTPPRHGGDPNFLFSLPPFVEDGQIRVEPSGGDDTAMFQAALNRLSAVGGGTMRLSSGDFFTGGTVYLP